jgi:zinc protease
MKHFIKYETRKLVTLLAVLCLLMVFFSCAGGAKSFASGGLGNASDPVPFMANAKTGILPSGLRYYLLENSRPEGRAFLTLAVNAGSVLETDEEQGFAHFVEHMAFSGTVRFPESELVNYLRSLGMRFGPEVNAYTSFDETVYGIEVPVETGSDGRKIIPETALAVIDDWTWGVSFDPKNVEKERLVIMEEYRSRLGAAERLRREMLPLLFLGSPYAERLPIGLPEIIENAPASRLENFYRKWYRPENMAVIIVGDYDAAFLEETLTEHFPSHESDAADETDKAAPEHPRYNLSEPKKGSVLSLIQTDSELTHSRVDLYWKRKAEPRRDDLAYYREGIIGYLASTMLSLRFEEEAAKSETPYVYAGGGMANYGYSSRYYVLVSQAKTGAVKDSLRELLLVKESLSRYGFTQSETDSAKASLVAYMDQVVSESDRQPSSHYVDSFTRHFLDDETVPDVEWELDAIKKLLPGITLKEINQTVKDYFADDDLSVFISAPEAEKDSLPTDAEIKTLVSAAKKAAIEPPVEKAAKGELLEKVPEPGAVVSETVDNETGAVRWKLGNGAEVILKETKNKNSEITLYALARGGTLSASDKAAVSALLASEMLNVSGLGSYTRAELTQMLLDKQVSFSFWTQSFIRGFQGAAAVKDIKTLFEMIHLGFTRPRFDPDAVKAMMDQRRSAMAFQENNPETVFGREITRTTYGNPRFHPLELADLDRANTDEAFAFIQTCLNPGDYTFVFTGNIDLPQIRSLVETYLASVPEAPAFNEWADIDPRRPSDTEKEIFKGMEERSAVYMGWFSPRPYTEEKSAAAAVLNDYLDIRLTEEIRETLGGVYSVSSWISLLPIPRGELSGGVYFFCDPKRAGELISAVRGEIVKIAEGTIDVNIFNKAVEALIKEQEESVQSNLYIAQSYANSAVIYRSPLSRLDKRPGQYRAVTSADIQKAAAEFLEGNSARVILYPEANR